MNEVRIGVQKEHKYLCFEIFYGGQKLHKYFRSFLTKDTSLLTCSYIGDLRNGRKFKCENKPFIAFILILKGFCFRFDFYKFNSNIPPLGRIRLIPKLKHRVGWSLGFKKNGNTILSDLSFKKNTKYIPVYEQGM